MDANSMFQHPFFRGIVEPEDNEYKDRMESIRAEQVALNKRIDKLLAVLDGEDEWMLTLKKKGDSCDG